MRLLLEMLLEMLLEILLEILLEMLLEILLEILPLKRSQYCYQINTNALEQHEWRFFKVRYSSVGIATCYGLDGSGI
jgi:hypothetical protein